ncbi:MAG: hypothetical protein M0O96_07170 [Desulforhopalus sp.]|nr:hypothetical protein [Desulforhopalus sp.]
MNVEDSLPLNETPGILNKKVYENKEMILLGEMIVVNTLAVFELQKCKKEERAGNEEVAHKRRHPGNILGGVNVTLFCFSFLRQNG